MMARIVMHYLVPVKKAPAPHMVSGELTGPGLRKLSEALQQPLGHQGQAFAPACDPKLKTDDTHRASGEAWALTTTVNGEMVIDPVACPACMATEAWQEAIKKNPHPRARQPEVDEVKEGCC